MTTAVSQATIAARECAEISIRVAASRSDREAAFRLAYTSYLRAGLCGPTPAQIRMTPYQLLASTDIFIAELRGEVIGTLSLVRDGELGLPLEHVYPEEVQQRRRAGLRVAEVSCLADRRRADVRFFGLFADLCRVMVQMADAEGIQQLLIAVHPRHARMYCRAMGFQQVGDNRDYPAVNGNPAVALCLDFHWCQTKRPDIWERFVGAPLPAKLLRAQPISPKDQQYFRAVSLITPERSQTAEPLTAMASF